MLDKIFKVFVVAYIRIYNMNNVCKITIVIS